MFRIIKFTKSIVGNALNCCIFIYNPVKYHRKSKIGFSGEAVGKASLSQSIRADVDPKHVARNTGMKEMLFMINIRNINEPKTSGCDQFYIPLIGCCF